MMTVICCCLQRCCWLQCLYVDFVVVADVDDEKADLREDVPVWTLGHLWNGDPTSRGLEIGRNGDSTWKMNSSEKMFARRDIRQFYPVKELLLAHWTIDPWCGRGLVHLRARLRSQQVHLVTILVMMIMIIMVMMMMMVVVAVVLSSMAMAKDCRINKFTW